MPYLKSLLIAFVCCTSALAQTSENHSIARQWNEVLLEGIRNDQARPTVHARNLFHSSLIMFDALAVYDENAEPFILGENYNGVEVPFYGVVLASGDEATVLIEEAINYGMFRLISHRFENSPGADYTLGLAEQLFVENGGDPNYISVDYITDGGAALGNFLASTIIDIGLQDGSNEEKDVITCEIIDTGPGIEPDLMMKVFQPFFSTKSAGKGSGLGLSMVLGFIKQSGGHVAVSSVVGEGTTVDLFLPRGTNINTSSEYHFTDGKEENSGELVGGSETVLIVDDESAVRETLTSLLSSLGYRTLQASSADSAIKQLITDSDVELVITDIVMPGINGFELAQQVHVCFPQIKILYCSGFATEAIMKGGNTPNINHILSKPYRISDLAHSVRRLLDDTSEQ